MKHPELAAIKQELEAAQAQSSEEAPPEAETIAEEVPVEPEEATAEDTETEVHSVNDLAQALGIEPEAFYSLPIKLKGGEEIPAGEVKDRLQALEQEKQQIAQQRAALEQQTYAIQQQAMAAQQHQSQITERAARAQQTLAGLAARYAEKEADWANRAAIEPGKVALEKQNLGVEVAAAKQELAAANAEMGQQQAMARQQWLMQQNQILTEKIPEWSDPEKRKTLQQDLQQFAMNRYGATAEELNRIDSKTLMLLKDALDGVRARQDAEAALDQVRQKAPVVPRGVKIAARKQASARVAELEQKALETGKMQDRLAAARAIVGR